MQIVTFFQQLLEKIYNLNEVEITFLVIATAFLVLYLVYRLLGLGAIIALTVLYVVGYMLYVNNFLDFYKNQENVKAQHMQEINEAGR